MQTQFRQKIRLSIGIITPWNIFASFQPIAQWRAIPHRLSRTMHFWPVKNFDAIEYANLSLVIHDRYSSRGTTSFIDSSLTFLRNNRVRCYLINGEFFYTEMFWLSLRPYSSVYIFLRNRAKADDIVLLKTYGRRHDYEIIIPDIRARYKSQHTAKRCANLSLG